MAFDFSKYTTDTSTPAANTASVAQYTPGFSNGAPVGLDPSIASQFSNYVGRSDADTQLLDQGVKQKLIDAGVLKSITEGGAEGGDAQTFYELGDNAPTNFGGHISRIDNTPEVQRLVSPTHAVGMGQKLFNPNMVAHDSTWGDLTTQGNIDPNESTFSKIGWKVAPLIPGILATIMSGGAMAPLLAELYEGGGATAGAMIGGQTVSDIAGGAIAQGGAATAGDFLSTLPAGLTSKVPDLVKGTIQGLGQSDGKFDFTKYIEGLAGNAASSLFGGAIDSVLPKGMSQWLAPALSTGVNLARGGKFDFSKYLPGMAGQAVSQFVKGT